MIFDEIDGKGVPTRAHLQVGYKEEKVAIVVLAQAVVDPGTVVVQGENTAVTRATVVRPCWLQFVTSFAFALPNLPQILHSLMFEFQYCLDFR